MQTFKEKLSDMTREELETYAAEIMKKKNKAENMLGDVFCAAKKQYTALNILIEDYEGQESPDAYAAVSWLSDGDKSNLAAISAQWYIEYDRIMWLINVASDYGAKMIEYKNGYEMEENN